MRIVPSLVVLLLLSVPHGAMACYWDSDTLSMEKRRFPGMLDLLHERVLRRSPALYEWRIKDVTRRLKTAPKDLRLLDELAVAHDKLGHHAVAISVAQRAMRIQPQRYETHANLGTFHLHAGELDAGVAHIEKALKINPNAHFGREIVQLELARYLISKRAKGAKVPTLPVAHDMYSEGGAGMDPLVDKLLDGYAAVAKTVIEPKAPWLDGLPRPIGFAAWLKNKQPKLLSSGAAARGLAGMLYFGNPRSPYLLEATADVLRYNARPKKGSTALAAAAYLKAGEQLKDNYAKMGFFAKAGRSLAGIRGATLAAHLKRLQAGVKRGRTIQDKIAKDEKKWIAAGKSPDVQFARAWYRAGGKELNRIVLFATPACDASVWGNLRKRVQVPRAEMLKLLPRPEWTGQSLASLIDRHGAPLCHFRGQWLLPLRTEKSGSPRGVWLKVAKRGGSAVVRLLEPPTVK
ncbi:MAG: hypothetical protein KC502_07005 [Myxococcales bacterium]|nr:hypothetical protein [Myxococcales bacterium]